VALATCLGLAAGAWARAVPALSRRVTDEAGVFSAADVARLEQKLAAYEQATGHQFAVLVVRSLEGEALEAFAIRVAEAWKLGDARRDDGLIVLLAVDDRAVRVEVGHGLEGAVPDVVAGRVIRDVMTPRFKSGDYAGGLEDGLDALMRAAQGENVGPAGSGKAPEPWTGALGLAIAALSVLAMLPRLVRVPIAVLIGAIATFAVTRSAAFAGIAALVAGLVALVLPRMRPSRRAFGAGAWRAGIGGMGAARGRGWSSPGRAGGFGGFSGGGGSFGGGGASGRW
jgi:uncharacterized protein